MMKWIHLVVGIAGVAAFLWTGQFMDQRLDHLVGMADGPRALYRSAHIYILFAALLNVVLGAYLVRSPTPIGQVAQDLGSVLLLLALGLVLYGFLVETPIGAIERPMIRKGIYATLLGVFLHAAAGSYPRPRGARAEPEDRPRDAELRR